MASPLVVLLLQIESALLERSAELGVATLFAVVMFLILRQTWKDHKEAMQAQNDKHREAMQAQNDKYDASVAKVTVALESVTLALRSVQAQIEQMQLLDRLEQRLQDDPPRRTGRS
jgi:uncharacterized protein YlxW (UPF0749 family)